MKQTKILIVEDDRLIRWSITDRLTGSGYCVTAVDSGERAVEALRHNDYSLLIADYMLPGMDGLSVAEEVRRHTPDIAILMISALRNLPLKETVRTGKIGAFLQKPFSLEELERHINTLLENDG
ncbi:MAG: response regulator [Bacteroidetes bacterium]|nr:response regulator [Bacteroidota bacterium]